MLVLSENDDYYDPAAIREWFTQRHPAVQLVHVPGWGHGDCVLHDDQKCDDVWQQVVRFVER